MVNTKKIDKTFSPWEKNNIEKRASGYKES